MQRLAELIRGEALDRFLLRLGVALASLIVVGLVLTVLGANPDNSIVSVFTSVAELLVGPLDGLFELDDPDGEIALNWGIAAAAYLLLGVVLADLAGRVRRRRSS